MLAILFARAEHKAASALIVIIVYELILTSIYTYIYWSYSFGLRVCLNAKINLKITETYRIIF